MNYKVYLTETFQKSMKILKKEYRMVKDDIAGTIQAIEEEPTIGDPIPGWNKEIWKVGTASSDVKERGRNNFHPRMATENKRPTSDNYRLSDN
ncbi:MAG: hypothetical protein HF982_09700 [Desulfobacteraceae bacterium]|nr:hypothetical protein [Desulfobacteraceae bacterium]MBC2719839.1 hypothetical protein [Desulfobacteraceae bacterium]